MKAKHLIKNWINGHYTVGPILKAHKGRITAFDSDGTHHLFAWVYLLSQLINMPLLWSKIINYLIS